MAVNQTITSSKKVAVTITLPSINVSAIIQKSKNKFLELFSNIYNPLSSGFSQASEGASSRARRMKFPKMNKLNFNKKHIKILLPIILGIIVIASIISLARSLPDAQSKPVDSTSSVTAPNALATINLDKKFSFPLKDEKGVAVGSFDYVILSASIQKQIIVQGQRATAVNGREFLILNLKITNNLKKTIQLNTKDYIRLTTVSSKDEQLAPEIHNDPVEVQAISTKFTRVGIALDEADVKRKINLKVGEIDGTKQDIDLNFKY